LCTRCRAECGGCLRQRRRRDIEDDWTIVQRRRDDHACGDRRDHRGLDRLDDGRNDRSIRVADDG
jgi:hypothetical protein